MDISEKQLKGKPRKVGRLGDRDIYHAKTKGGLHMMMAKNGARTETLGAGSHVAVARHMASLYEPSIEWTELSKSDDLPLELFEDLLPYYKELTEKLRTLE